MMKKTIYLFLYICIINIMVVFFASCLWAQEASAETGTPKASEETFTLDSPTTPPLPALDLKKTFFKMTLSLLVVLALILVFGIAFKKFYSFSGAPQKGKGLLRVVEKFPLAPKNYLLLVWAIDRMLLLSYNSGAVTKIGEFKSETITNDAHRDLFEDSLQREIAKESLEEVQHVS